MNELDLFKREINLIDYAVTCGYEVDRKESSRNSVVLRNTETNDKIIVGRRGNQEHWTYFSVRDDTDHGTIIDFLQRRGHPNLGELRKELRSWLGNPHPRALSPSHSPAARTADRQLVRTAFASTSRPTNSHYLNSRGLRPDTLNAPRFEDTWRVDRRGNILFPHFDRNGLAGFELKNRNFTGFATGGTKALWHSQITSADTRVVFTESAIDALSFHQLNPNDNTRYYSTAGALSEHQRSLIAHELEQLPANTIIVSAFDNDTAGEHFHKQLQQLAAGSRCSLSRAPAPLGKDWNDCLQERERSYIASLDHPHPAPPTDLERVDTERTP